jgi:hypothetical protein
MFPGQPGQNHFSFHNRKKKKKEKLIMVKPGLGGVCLSSLLQLEA